MIFAPNHFTKNVPILETERDFGSARKALDKHEQRRGEQRENACVQLLWCRASFPSPFSLLRKPVTLYPPTRQTSVGESTPPTHMASSSTTTTFTTPIDDGTTLSLHLFHAHQVEEIRAHLHEQGVVAVRDVLSAEQCERTLADMHALWREQCPSHLRDDLSTYSAWPKRGLQRYGLLQCEPVFRAQALRNRQTPALLTLGRALLNCEQVLCSHDRYGLMRPTLPAQPEWSTHRNLHLDLDPWLYHAEYAGAEESVRDRLNALRYDASTGDGRRCFLRENNLAHALLTQPLFLQGSLNLVENRAEDGGFQCVPRSHIALREWVRTHARHHHCDSEVQDGFSFQVHSAPHLWAAARRVAPLPRGTLLLWDQRLAHGSLPNCSGRTRAAQFLRVFDASLLGAAARRRRREALSSLLPEDFALSPAGRVLFDLPEEESTE
jgi:Phytanoyl-CoA dioxygenase (PhyH)